MSVYTTTDALAELHGIIMSGLMTKPPYTSAQHGGLAAVHRVVAHIVALEVEPPAACPMWSEVGCAIALLPQPEVHTWTTSGFDPSEAALPVSGICPKCGSPERANRRNVSCDPYGDGLCVNPWHDALEAAPPASDEVREASDRIKNDLAELVWVGLRGDYAPCHCDNGNGMKCYIHSREAVILEQLAILSRALNVVESEGKECHRETDISGGVTET